MSRFCFLFIFLSLLHICSALYHGHGYGLRIPVYGFCTLSLSSKYKEMNQFHLFLAIFQRMSSKRKSHPMKILSDCQLFPSHRQPAGLQQNIFRCAFIVIMIVMVIFHGEDDNSDDALTKTPWDDFWSQFVLGSLRIITLMLIDFFLKKAFQIESYWLQWFCN